MVAPSLAKRSSLTARPLVAAAADRARFVDIGNVHCRVVSGLRNGFNVLVDGPRGSGKTTLLHMIRGDLEDGGAAFVFLGEPQLRSDPTSTRLLRTLYAHLIDVLEYPADPPDGDDYDLLAAIASLVQDHESPVTVLLDSPDPAAAHAIFGTMRDEVWAAGITWLVACDTTDRAEMTRPPADAFWDSLVHIPAPTAEEVRLLLERRGVPAAIPPSWDTTAMTPRTVLAAARLDPENPGAGLTARARRNERALAISPPALALVLAMESLGPVTTHDPVLAQTLGWTRGRIAQVMGQLREAGLASGTETRVAGPGRPRMLYALASLDDEFADPVVHQAQAELRIALSALADGRVLQALDAVHSAQDALTLTVERAAGKAEGP